MLKMPIEYFFADDILCMTLSKTAQKFLLKTVIFCDFHNFGFVTARPSEGQARSQGLSSLPPLVVRTETLIAAGHVTISLSKTAGWVGTQLHLVERTIKYHPGEGNFFGVWF